ncbi:EAL domain-containing protein [Spirulina sp. CS-785/01]|uniref:putative bifunctional diguanylate cyclase/phosphodiesterase n=1 Tax=Spirulina sp. CS-785/01 TaxID=3021716 RepID=UPI0023313A9E|nr:EAL domain-containing response regulator [Spirulina sp. CS-785/01]MDB9314113.1 EAL domain-containing protein [Spirulina sp. CS-785/01]
MPSQPASILVVDDEIELQRLIERRLQVPLEKGEFQFLFATNGVEAMEQLAQHPEVSVVLTDLNMPGMDGFALLEQIPKIDPFLKAVVVSAYGDIENIRTAMNRGAFDFLTKPINFRDLMLTIRKTVSLVCQARQQQAQLENAVASLHYLAHHDPLTGLPNQNAILERIRAAIEARESFAVLFLDLNRFQVIKYGFGDVTAEEFLIQGVKRLGECLAGEDMLARVWKDEFALFLPGMETAEVAKERAEQFHDALEFSLGDRPIASFHSHIGIALSSLDYSQAEDFLRAADTAMHYARMQTSKHNTMLFNPEMQVAVFNRLQLESELETALKEQEFRLYYQPIFNLETLKLAGFEALLRWQHPQKGIISPSHFVSVAEETGLILPLGEWILQEACDRLHHWHQQYPESFPFFMSINLSGIQLLNVELPDYIERLLSHYKLKGSQIKLEITESVLMDNTEVVMRLLERFREQNIRLSIDDFGTGYSSLSYLQSLPLDTLKIDQSFVKNMDGSQKSLDIVKTIITLAHSLGLDVIGEGIETQRQFQILQTLGCELGQGFYFSPPLDPKTMFSQFPTVGCSD